ncbi:MAG: sensor histidine kinase N-terminal domain-containing protein [Burkholderiaceae bacterium]
MTLQRRLLIGLLLAAGLLWLLAVAFYYVHARQEVDELFDTVQVRMAQQIRSTLADRPMPAQPLPPAGGAGTSPVASATPSTGHAELDDMAVTVWDEQGRARLDSDLRVPLPWIAGQAGFLDVSLGKDLWRVYYLPVSPVAGQSWLIAVGFKMEERAEMLSGLIYSQMLYWFLLLPALALATWFVVRYAFRPLSDLSANLARRDAADLTPISAQNMPSDLHALVDAMNALFRRIETTLANERRLVADAAHELRTPLAALRAPAQDAARLAPHETARSRGIGPARCRPELTHPPDEPVAQPGPVGCGRPRATGKIGRLVGGGHPGHQ